jgi:hypothetical protein
MATILQPREEVIYEEGSSPDDGFQLVLTTRGSQFYLYKRYFDGHGPDALYRGRSMYDVRRIVNEHAARSYSAQSKGW